MTEKEQIENFEQYFKRKLTHDEIFILEFTNAHCIKKATKLIEDKAYESREESTHLLDVFLYQLADEIKALFK